MNLKRLLPLALAISALGLAHGAQVAATSYSMPNGMSGGYQYWDDTYNGSGCITCDSAALTGGLGDLTDGIIATSSWEVVEAPAGAGPYVGWQNINPTISFHFGKTVSIGSVTVYMDDSQFGGVVAPASVTILGTTYPVTNPPGTAPFAFVASGLNFVGSDLDVTVNRNGAWTFLSEIQFQSPVPELGTNWMLLGGLLVLLGVKRLRCAKA